MNKKEMWTIMSELWEWLSENPMMDKKDWPGWKECPPCVFHCLCCEYVGKNKLKCNECPAIGLWTDEQDRVGPCQDVRGSPFRKWFFSTNEEVRTTAAKKISDYAKEKLKQLQ